MEGWCSCWLAETDPHKPHERLFCRAPIRVVDPAMIALLRSPPKPPKTEHPVEIEE